MLYDDLDLGFDLETISGDGYTVEDILAEFRSDTGAVSPAEDIQYGQPEDLNAAAPEPIPEPASPAPPAPPTPTAAQEESPAARAGSSWTFEEKKRSRPSEDEIRSFLSAYARGEYGGEEAAEEAPRYPGDPEVDARFHLGDDRRDTLRYAGSRVDMSADEDYQPPEAPEYISSYISEDEDEPETPDEAPRLALLGRLRDRFQRQRAAILEKEEARRVRQAPKTEYPKTEELILPEEQTEEAATLAEEAPTLEDILREDAAPAAPAARPAAEEATRIFSAVGSVPPAEAAGDDDETGDELKPSWSRSAASHRAYAAVFPDTSASPAVYAEESDYAFEEEEPPAEDEAEALKGADFFPSSFKEYLFSMLTSVLYRLRGSTAGTLTMEDDDEDLGAEAAPSFASKYYGSHIRSMRLRLRISGGLLLLLAWLSLGLPVTGRLNDPAVASFFCLAIQLVITLLCLDVFTGGILNGVRCRPGADTMAVLACFVTAVDAVFSAVDGFSAAHMPLCLLSSLSLVGVLLSSLVSCRGLRKALRVPAIARRSYTVTGENNTQNGEVTLLKSVRPAKGFVRRSEEAAPDETLFRKLCLPTLLLVLVLALVAAAVKRNIRDLFYILSVLLCPAVPFSSLLCFALPYFTGSMRLFPSGAALAGWSGTCDIGQSKNLIVTDRDLFPDGTVKIDTVRIFADADPQRIISYAGSMLTACGSSVSGCFGELMRKNGGTMRQIENFEYLPGGGLKGIIDSSVILCGSTDLMQLMNVRIPYRLVNRSSVLLAVDGILYGIFNMKYTALPAVRDALIDLMRSGRHPVFAIRDFNVTPSMLHECFDVATDGYDFPPYVERFAMSEGTPGPDSKIAAVVCRDGLGPLSDTADVGRSVYVATRASLLITVLGLVIGVLMSFVQLLRTGGVGIPLLFFFMLLWALPVGVIGLLLRLDR